MSSLGYPGILGYLGTLGYCRVLASLVHSTYWLHMKLMRDRSTYEFLAINSQHSAQKKCFKNVYNFDRHATHTLALSVCVCLLHVCTFAPLSRGAFWPRHAPVARCPCPCLSPRSPNRVQCPQGVVFVVSEGVSITYCGRRAAGETCVVFSMNFHTHTETNRLAHLVS